MSDSPRKDSRTDEAESRPESVLPWRRQIEQMRETRRKQFLRVSRKMLNHLCSIGLKDAQKILKMGDAVTGIEIRVNDIYDAEEIGEKIVTEIGSAYWTKDWMQRNRNLLSALKLEKART